MDEAHCKFLTMSAWFLLLALMHLEEEEITHAWETPERLHSVDGTYEKP